LAAFLQERQTRVAAILNLSPSTEASYPQVFMNTVRLQIIKQQSLINRTDGGSVAGDDSNPRP